MERAAGIEDPPGSRLFIVCGRSVEEETLRAAFRPYGIVQQVKVIREKGVAYVKFDKASSAALAMESLNGAVLNNGRGPKLKVLLAEAPTPKGVQMIRPPMEDQLSTDPDNMPPRSRLFLVVPKTAEARIIQEEASRYPDLEYCKTDLIASKGVAFCKYAKASSALTALEDVAAKGMLGPYKVKVMLAEPKTKRNKMDALGAMGLFTPQGKLDLALSSLALDQSAAFRLAAAANPQFPGFNFGAPGSGPAGMLGQQGPGGLGHGVMDYGGLAGPGPLQGLGGLGMGAGGGMDLSGQFGFPGLNALAPSSTPDSSMGTALTGSGLSGFHSSPGNGSMNSQASSLSTVNFPAAAMNFMGLNSGLQQQGFPGAGGAGPSGSHHGAQGGGQGGLPPTPVSKQRLFVVVHKSVTEDVLQRLFRQYPGMEYCDLKKDRATGKSKGYCYVNYSTPVAAAAAVEQLNGMEFPPGTGFRIKVMFAEVLSSHGSSGSLRSAGGGSSRGGSAGGSAGGNPVAVVAAGGGPGAAGGPGPSANPVAAVAAAAGLHQQGVLTSSAASPSSHRGLGGPSPIGSHHEASSSLPLMQHPVQDTGLASMGLPRMGDSSGVAAVGGGGPDGSGYDLGGATSSGLNTSPVNHQVARELMFSVGA